jgi:hypothetical protein
MKVTGLNGKAYILSLGGESIALNKSKYHLAAREVIKGVFSSTKLSEEVHIPGCPSTMYIDFFIPLMKIGIEVQGEQHYKMIGHFHKDKAAYYLARKRDREKAEWCELNGISLIEFPYNESPEQWEARLRNVYRTD